MSGQRARRRSHQNSRGAAAPNLEAAQRKSARPAIAACGEYYRLTIKEMRSFRSDPIMLLLSPMPSPSRSTPPPPPPAPRRKRPIGQLEIVDEDRRSASQMASPPTFQAAGGRDCPDGHRRGDQFATLRFCDRNSPEIQRQICSPDGSRRLEIDVDATAVAQAFNGMVSFGTSSSTM